MADRLRHSRSPYLQQHRDNPVDWWEWGPEAFAEARRRDVPVLVSTGYAACHWCHVMAHESFEDPATAEHMNERFVCVKVDREERPDVDAVHMAATTALTGQGGWPMTTFCTPGGEVFFAGTYFPPRPHPQVPSFRQVLAAVDEAWRERRAEVLGSSARIARALGEVGTPSGGAPPGEDDLEAAVAALAEEEDRVHGGFGGAPKFPPSAVVEFLLRHAARTGDERAAGIAARTLTAIARSGTCDQVAGGFARYAVDAGWVVPHFEKMLYDNALLARAYLHSWRATGDEEHRRVAEQACEWIVTGLGTPEGAFAASLDADTPVADADGHVRAVEGATYVWTPGDLVEVLGIDDGPWAAGLLGVTGAGTFEHGTSTARLTRALHGEELARWLRVRERLAAARADRPQPTRDDKVVLAWNGLALAALAEAGALLARPDLLLAARTAAEFLVRVHCVDGRWRRVSRDGVVGAPAAVLEDLGDLAEGLLALHAATGEHRWARAAREVCEEVLAEFTAEGGGFHDVAAHAVDPALHAARGGAGRPSDPSDGATPSGWSAAAGALLSVGALTGESRFTDAAVASLGALTLLARQAPRFAGWGLAVAEALHDGPREVAVLGDPGDPGAAELHRLALAGTAPGLVVARGVPGESDPPLLAQRGLVDGRAAAYVCRGRVCEAPTTDPAALAAAVGARTPRPPAPPPLSPR
ncbi:thioredoxin domain-containing protein [Kineococcus sp. SYSU DK005]|uniref:thioredoxin domain-containing protein n=1 Tax=Kineococcus sp. SYSU DK005 TaxID=3383126 RepID=UPI003D7D08C3